MSTYNENLNWIQESVESILNQTFIDFEFIIVIDNPQNKSIINLLMKYQKKDSRIELLFNCKNIGLVDSLNKAIDYSSGKYIVRMDADDIACKNRLQEQIDFMKKNPEFDLLGSKIVYIDENSNICENLDFSSALKSDLMNQSFIKKIHKYTNLIPHPTWVFKKEVYKEIKGYRKIKYAEDYDFVCRLLINNKKICMLNKKLLKYRKRSNSISASNKLLQLKSTLFIQKLYKSGLKNKEMEFNYDKYLDFINCKKKESENYSQAYELYEKAKSSFDQKKYFLSVKYIFSSILKSKLIIKKLTSYFKKSYLYWIYN